MRRTRTGLVLACLLALASGCRAHDSEPPAAGADGKPVEAKDPVAERAGTAEEPLVEPQPPDDDVSPPAKHGLVRGLESLRKAIPVEKGRPSQGAVDLQQADRLLSSVKEQNLAALREANRQVRIAGRGPNLVLVVAQGLDCEQLGCYGKVPTQTPHIDKLAAEGIRFTSFQGGGAASDVAQWSLMTGLPASRVPAAQPAMLRPKDFSLANVLWSAGFATGLVGDCSLGGAIAPGDAAGQGFEAWSGYRDSAQGCSAWPEYLWYQGNRARVLENSDGKRGRSAADLLAGEAASFLGRHRRGRPFFLYLSWPQFGQRTSGKAVAGPSPSDETLQTAAWTELDRALGALVGQLKGLNLDRKTILLLIGAGGPRPGVAGGAPPERPAAGPSHAPGSGRPAPLIVWAPQRFSHGVRDQRCTSCDILPTLADLAEAHRRPPIQTGTSLVPLLRGGRPAND